MGLSLRCIIQSLVEIGPLAPEKKIYLFIIFIYLIIYLFIYLFIFFFWGGGAGGGVFHIWAW